jgi:ribonuclease III
MHKELNGFEDATGVVFKDKALLKRAFTHRSYLNEHRDEGLEHNERLEFLGDAVLELVATEHLYTRFPEKNEGELTALRSALVNTNTLSDAAASLSMNDYLLLSKGEAKDQGRARAFLLANTFEALVGALYLDLGYDAARIFITAHLFPKIDDIIEKRLWQDAKSHFQEKSQEEEGVTPTYTVMRESGPDHDKKFVVGAYIKSALIAQGEGRSKQEAETDAARAALEVKGW